MMSYSMSPPGPHPMVLGVIQDLKYTNGSYYKSCTALLLPRDEIKRKKKNKANYTSMFDSSECP